MWAQPTFMPLRVGTAHFYASLACCLRGCLPVATWFKALRQAKPGHKPLRVGTAHFYASLACCLRGCLPVATWFKALRQAKPGHKPLRVGTAHFYASPACCLRGCLPVATWFKVSTARLSLDISPPAFRLRGEAMTLIQHKKISGKSAFTMTVYIG